MSYTAYEDADDSILMGDALTVKEGHLLDYGFPMLTFNGKAETKRTVAGELWWVRHNDVCYGLDRLEGFPSLYNRELIKVMVGDIEYEAWAYLANRGPDDNGSYFETLTDGDTGAYTWTGLRSRKEKNNG
jgi:hypothetical protein